MTDTKPQGVFITLDAIYATVVNIDQKMDSELRAVQDEISKVKSQLAAQWVVHGILLTTIVFLVQKGLA